MRAVITVVGCDSTGIIAKVSGKCAEYSANIIDISQSVLKEYFTMMMLVDIDKITIDYKDFVDIMTELGNENSLEIHMMHEDIFNSMHKI